MTMISKMMMMMLVISTKSHIILIVTQRYQGTQFKETVQRRYNRSRQSYTLKLVSPFNNDIIKTSSMKNFYVVILRGCPIHRIQLDAGLSQTKLLVYFYFFYQIFNCCTCMILTGQRAICQICSIF